MQTNLQWQKADEWMPRHGAQTGWEEGRNYKGT